MTYRGKGKAGLDLQSVHPDQIIEKVTEAGDTCYLGITVYAECDSCDAVTCDAEGEGWTTNPEYTKYQCPECQDQYKPISLSGKITEDGDQVVFNRGTEVLTMIPIEAIRQAAIVIYKLVELVPFASITLSPDETYTLRLDFWKGDEDIKVSLVSDVSPFPLYTWDLYGSTN